jgi:hypothetical protein
MSDSESDGERVPDWELLANDLPAETLMLLKKAMDLRNCPSDDEQQPEGKDNLLLVSPASDKRDLLDRGCRVHSQDKRALAGRCVLPVKTHPPTPPLSLSRLPFSF